MREVFKDDRIYWEPLTAKGRALNMGFIIGYTKVAWYFLKCVVLVPFNVVKDGVLVRYRLGRPFDYDLIQRIASRTMLELSDATVLAWLINPYLSRAVKALHIPNAPHRGEIEFADERLKDDDVALLTRSVSAQLTEDVHIKMRWFYKPNTFDPRKDPIIYYLHGGAFVLGEMPSAEVFLGHIHQAHPGVAIIMLDYTLASESNDASFPTQILETLAGYEWLRVRNGCQHIWMVGDSCGGNLLLSLLELLQKSARPIPEKAVAISPWVNPTVPDKEIFAKYQRLDNFSSGAAQLFSGYYAPDIGLLHNPFLNLEHNFEVQAWRHVLEQTELLITYGSDEINQGQIKRMAEKLAEAAPDKFSLEKNLVADEKGCHSRLVLSSHLELDNWLKIEANRSLVTFLNRS